MAFVKGAGNITITYDGDSYEDYMDSASLNAVVNAIETTDLADTAATTSIAGLGSWTVDIGGPWDATLDGYANPDTTSPPTTLKTLVVVLGGSVTYTWTTNSFISNYSVNVSSPSEAITWSATLTASGAPVIS